MISKIGLLNLFSILALSFLISCQQKIDTNTLAKNKIDTIYIVKTEYDTITEPKFIYRYEPNTLTGLIEWTRSIDYNGDFVVDSIMNIILEDSAKFGKYEVTENSKFRNMNYFIADFEGKWDVDPYLVMCIHDERKKKVYYCWADSFHFFKNTIFFKFSLRGKKSSFCYWDFENNRNYSLN